MNKYYLSRSLSRMASLDMPVGDATGGPAYGGKTDVGTIAGIGAPIVSGILGSDAAGDAADAQSAAAARSDATQRYMYDTTRSDNAPFLRNGTAANNQLAMLLGLGTAGSGKAKTSDDFYNELMDQWKASSGVPGSMKSNFGVFNGSDIVPDEAALRAAADRMAAQQQTTNQEPANPLYGSLTRKFTMDDLNNDPVYQTGKQFGIDEGNKGIERQAAASGSMLSGATLKALAKYATDYAGTKAGEAYSRFTNDQTNTYNRLAGISGTGQQANGLVASTGVNTANNISANQIGVGNARAASAIGSANAWGGAIGQGINGYQQNQLLKSLQNRNGSTGTDYWNASGSYGLDG